MAKRSKRPVQRTTSVDAAKPPALKLSAIAAPDVSGAVPLRWWLSLHSYLLLALATILCLAPFSGRAFHVDDALFVWAAKQIAQHPLDPYGFQLNWDAKLESMADVTQNPPLGSYYAALIGRLLGWSERALHSGFIVVAVALVLGTYRLAQRFTRRPLLAALAVLLTPGVLISASIVMCDTMMLAFWMWAIVFWMEGLDSRKPLFLMIAGVLGAASALSKYFGASLIPLLLLYSLMRHRALRAVLLWLLIPIAALVGYQVWTESLYGHGLLTQAADFAASQRAVMGGSIVAMAIVGLSFSGGCSLLGLTFASIAWPRKQLVIVGVVSLVASVAVMAGWLKMGLQIRGGPVSRFHFLTGTQLFLCVAGGIFLLGLAVRDWWKNRDAESLLLALWLLGTFLFAAFVNYTVNARSVLPLIPAGGILLARRIDEIRPVSNWRADLRLGLILLVSGLFSLWMVAGDSSLANSQREAATLINEKIRGQGGTVWFEGHWGFQYYMESLGARPVDFNHVETVLGDIVVIPENNIHLRDIPQRFVAYRDGVILPQNAWATTISSELGAGFYSSYWGPIPFAVGPVPPERYAIIHLAALPASTQ